MMNEAVSSEVYPAMNRQLPGLHNQLPQWSRVGQLDKARYPKPFLKDRLQPLPPPPGDDRLQDAGSDKELDTANDINPSQRIQHLEKSIIFLKQQHYDVLSSLHNEIETLRKENKDLQFQLVMRQKTTPESRKTSAASNAQGRSRENTQGSASIRRKPQSSANGGRVPEKPVKDVRSINLLEEETKRLKLQLQEERNKNAYLTSMLEKEKKGNKGSSSKNQLFPQTDAGGASASSSETNSEFGGEIKKIYTTEEYEALIRHLRGLNGQQANELSQLKSELRDVLQSNKWSPDAFLLAKAYIAEDDMNEGTHPLPRIRLRQQNRKLPDGAYVPRDNVSLPALKQTLGNKAAERRRRTQILQKARLNNKEVP